MNPTNRLVYRDQETAERIANELWISQMSLITRLRDANRQIDSLELNRILDEAEYGQERG